MSALNDRLADLSRQGFMRQAFGLARSHWEVDEWETVGGSPAVTRVTTWRTVKAARAHVRMVRKSGKRPTLRMVTA